MVGIARAIVVRRNEKIIGPLSERQFIGVGWFDSVGNTTGRFDVNSGMLERPHEASA